MKLKSIGILLVILVSLLPVYWLTKKMQRLIRPRESMKQFIIYLSVVLAMIFVYTFFLVLLIKLMFPAA